MFLRLEPVRLALRNDVEGRLVFGDDALLAILVRLSRGHEAGAGSWFLEVAFGRLEGRIQPIFADLAAAQSWIMERLQRPPGTP